MNMKTKLILGCILIAFLAVSCKTDEPEIPKLGEIKLSSPDDLEEFDLDYTKPQTALTFKWGLEDSTNVSNALIFSLDKKMNLSVKIDNGSSLRKNLTHFQLDSILNALGVKEYKRGEIYWAIESKRGNDVVTSKVRSMKLFRFYKPFVDPRDGEVYQVCRVVDPLTGDYAVWMAENMRATKYSDGTPITEVKFYEPAGSNDSKFVKPFGGYYTWNATVRGSVGAQIGDTIQGIAPNGWHIPTKLEWVFLINSVDQGNGPGTELKDPTLWDPTATNIGTNSIGFNLAGAGYRWSMDNEVVESLGFTCFWTSTAPMAGDIYPWNPPAADFPTQGVTYAFNKNDFGVALYPYPRVRGFSVRCVLN